jgi:hypothetical protein
MPRILPTRRSSHSKTRTVALTLALVSAISLPMPGALARGAPLLETVTFEAPPAQVPAPNRSPIALGDLSSTRQEAPVAIDVLANDADPDRDPLTLISFSQGEHGSVSCGGVRPPLCTYTPEVEFVGNDGFAYTVADGRGGTATATVSVAVLPPHLNLASDEP